MAREETIRKVLDTVLWTGNASDDNKRILTNALIKALEKEPCEDAISRQAVLACKQTFHDNAGYETEYVDVEDIKALSSVQPKSDVFETIIAGLESHKWGKDEGSKAVYDGAIDDAITYVKECVYPNSENDLER